MKDLFIKEGKLSPKVAFDTTDGTLTITGNSTMDDAKTFYKPLFEASQAYSLQPQKDTLLNIQLTYITNDSAKYLLDLIMLMENLHQQNKSAVNVNWYYTNDNMKQEGENFKLLITTPFNIIASE